jgi:dihydrofolate reductase
MEGCILSAPIHATEYDPNRQKHFPIKMIRMIAACAHNGVMGAGGTLPWKIAEDWKYFLETTHGDALLMGRRSYEDFTEYAQSRKVVVLSRNPSKKFPHAQQAHNLKEGLAMAAELSSNIWVCGGREIYQEAMVLAEELYLTLIDAEYEGDVYFPKWKKFFTREISRKELTSNQPKLTFLILGK